jgi:D-glycero-alpha-D-manno-heptose-7-phosphate kinase
MMIIAKCPLRISLVGGSTDLEAFVEKYRHGSVISFPSDLYTYISIHDNHTNQYIINYVKKEEVHQIHEIKNDVAREALAYFNVGPITVTFNADILSEGSGLAASTSYMIAIVKALSLYQKLNLSDFEICRIALALEHQFNPLTGYQDSYGAGIGGFKRIDFHAGRRPSFRYLDVTFLEQYDMYLMNTGIKRSSTTVLKAVDIDKSACLLPLVDEMEQAIDMKNYAAFERIFHQGWVSKKATAASITQAPKIKQMDTLFSNSDKIHAVKLCGAGGGGYFLLFCDKHQDTEIQALFGELGSLVKIQANAKGVVGWHI